MKYYSEKLNKNYDTVEELEKAEKEAEEKALTVSAEKKELSKNIEKAENTLDIAYQHYDMAKKEAQKILEEANKKAREIMSSARESVSKAQKERYDAISKFNDKYGSYSVVLTGEKAYDEIRRFDETWNDIFRSFFSIF